MSLGKFKMRGLKEKYFENDPRTKEEVKLEKKAVKPAKVKVEKPKVKKKKR